MPHLQYSGADGVTVRFPLLRRLTTIGASKDCDLVLAGAEPTHCTVEHEAGNYKIQSTSRSAVFFVGGKKLRDHTLRHGDVFAVGGVELAFAAIDPQIPAADPESANKLQIEAMRQLQRFSELLLREESSLDGLLSELIDQVVSLTGANKGFLVLAEGPDRYDVRVARGLDRQPVDEPEQLLSDKIIRAVITAASRRSSATPTTTRASKAACRSSTSSSRASCACRSSSAASSWASSTSATTAS
jgi:predicted component of type VI protein secretion system